MSIIVYPCHTAIFISRIIYGGIFRQIYDVIVRAVNNKSRHYPIVRYRW